MSQYKKKREKQAICPVERFDAFVAHLNPVISVKPNDARFMSQALENQTVSCALAPQPDAIWL